MLKFEDSYPTTENAMEASAVGIGQKLLTLITEPHTAFNFSLCIYFLIWVNKQPRQQWKKEQTKKIIEEVNQTSSSFIS